MLRKSTIIPYMAYFYFSNTLHIFLVLALLLHIASALRNVGLRCFEKFFLREFLASGNTENGHEQLCLQDVETSFSLCSGHVE